MKYKDLVSRLQGATNAFRGSQPSGLPATKRDYEDLRKVNGALLPLLALGLVAAVGIGWHASAVGPVLLWCVSCLAAGATTGFLFGIPRAGSGSSKAPAATETKSDSATTPDKDVTLGRPNTNLEEVSDWLTKIIVGLTLVNLDKIETKVQSISANAAAALNASPTASDISTATALVVGFSVIGFLCGYLYTRLFLQGAFSRSDSEMRQFSDVLHQELAQADPGPTPVTGQPSIPSQSDRQSAERVLEATPSGQPSAVLVPLRALAVEYQQLRQILPYGAERTRKMSEVVARMKKLALAAKPYLPELARSNAPGERLAAVVVLQMDFDPDYIEWLANRIPDESAFIGYQAASALLARARVSGPPEKARIGAAVEAAAGRVTKHERERDALVEEILKEVRR